jgi:hypothetical protein
VELTDEQWEAVRELIPAPPRCADGRGRPWRDTRPVLEWILWVLRVVFTIERRKAGESAVTSVSRIVEAKVHVESVGGRPTTRPDQNQRPEQW